MQQFGRMLVVAGAAMSQLAVCVEEMPYVLKDGLDEEVGKDDNKEVLQKLRTKISEGLNKTYGVVMVSTSLDYLHSVHTIPIWKAYCEKHGYDFFLQEETLVPDVRDHWTKPRLLIELVSKAKWKYLWLVDSNSLPVNLDKPWQYLIKEHMRKMRYRNDNQKERIMFCPEDCEKEAEVGEGTCYGPHVSGCILWMKPKKILPILTTWYGLKSKYNSEPRGLKLALQKTRETSHYDEMFWADVGEEMGRGDSTFMVTHNWDEKLGYNTRDQIVRTITKHRLLGDVINEKGEHRSDLLKGEL